MKKLIIKIAYLFFPVLIIVVSISYYVDPANLFSSGKDQKEMAKCLADGYNITGGDDLTGNSYHNEWLFQKYFIEYQKTEPDVVVLGSSRCMLINSTMFSGRLVNNGIIGASLEDILAVYSLYPKHNLKPKTVVWAIDPWMLNEDCQQLRWFSVSDDFYKMLEIIGLEKYVPNKAINYSVLKGKFEYKKDIFTFSYFQKSIGISGLKAKFIPTKVSVNDNITRLVDGSIVFDKKYREADSATVDESSKSFSVNPFSLYNFTRFSTRNKEIVEKFIEYLEKQDVKVIFFMSPYNPVVYNYFKVTPKFKLIIDTEKYYRDLAKKHNIQIIGSFNPNTFSLGIRNFSDGAHCTASTIKNFFSNPNDSIK